MISKPFQWTDIWPDSVGIYNTTSRGALYKKVTIKLYIITKNQNYGNIGIKETI